MAHIALYWGTPITPFHSQRLLKISYAFPITPALLRLDPVLRIKSQRSAVSEAISGPESKTICLRDRSDSNIVLRRGAASRVAVDESLALPLPGPERVELVGVIPISAPSQIRRHP
jgi:hypothetical protein